MMHVRPILAWTLAGVLAAGAADAAGTPTGYGALTALFTDWRAFEHPVLKADVPDYTATAMAIKVQELGTWQARLEAIDRSGFTAAQQNDYRLVKAEMNGLDFNLRILRPWARDPAFYVSIWAERSDVPSREGPVVYPEIQLYNYHWPLDAKQEKDLTAKIGAIPALLKQAELNLRDSTAHDLWVFSSRELRNQAGILSDLQSGSLTVMTLEGRQHADLARSGAPLRSAVKRAIEATQGFVAYIEREAPGKIGPSGVGKENYTWYQQNVHLVPYTWDDEVALLTRELERAHSAQRLEEHRNRGLPPLPVADDAASFEQLSRTHLDRFTDFLVSHQIIPDKPYIKPALEVQRGSFVPEEKRVFFTRVTHREPMLLYSHDYHWIDLARMRDEPHASPIRRVPQLSNIWDTRAEGFATEFEELLGEAGLYDDNPRGKELVYSMLANRAARGLASLYVQANQIGLEEAGRFHAAWTPRGWAVAGDQLTAFEQLLYLRQPGYGTCYITGKLLFERLMAEYSHQQELSGAPFVLRDFLDRFNSEGMIPVPLMEAELIQVRDSPVRPAP